MAEHRVGRGIIELIREHEPLALTGDAEATARVMNDLADTVAGLLAFVIQFHGEAAAHGVAMHFANRIGRSTGDIFVRAHEMAKEK